MPNTSYTYLSATSMTGNLTNQTGNAFNGLLDIDAVNNTLTTGSVTLKLTDDKTRVGALSRSQNNSWAALKRMSVHTALEREPAAEILSMYTAGAGRALEQMAGGAQLNMANSTQTSTAVSRTINMRMADISKTVNVQANVKVNGLQENEANKDYLILGANGTHKFNTTGQ